MQFYPSKCPFHKRHGSHFDTVFGRPLTRALIHLKLGIKMKLSKSWIRSMHVAFPDSKLSWPTHPPETVMYPSKTVGLDHILTLTRNRFAGRLEIMDGEIFGIIKFKWAISDFRFVLQISGGATVFCHKCVFFRTAQLETTHFQEFAPYEQKSTTVNQTKQHTHTCIGTGWRLVGVPFRSTLQTV